MIVSKIIQTFGTNKVISLLRSLEATQRVSLVRPLASSSQPTGGTAYLSQIIEDLKKRGFKENGDLSSQNIFKLFQLEQKLTISDNKLKREYLRFQRFIHPDRFVNSNKATQDKALELASIVNDAYETLRHPYKRAKYLISLTLGQSQDDLDKSLDSLKMDDAFLARMMELREHVELSKDINHLLRLSLEIEDELTRIMSSMEKTFKEKNTSALLEQLGKLKFLGNLHVKLADRTESFSSF